MNEFDKFWMEYLRYQAKTGKDIKIVKMREEYFKKVNDSLPDNMVIGEGIPYQIDNEIVDNYVFIS